MDYNHNQQQRFGLKDYPRQLNLLELLEKKSFFLFGARSTGKTSLIQKELKGAKVYDLLDAKTQHSLLREPSLIEQELSSDKQNEIIVIDEIQKLPQLLDEVHRVLNNHDVRFLLTGSSARKLKRGGANLLAGRAWQAELFPFTSREIPDFDLLRFLNIGGLPQVYTSDFPDEELRNYVGTYLKEEIQAESLSRNLPAFAAFLDAISLANGKEINFESLASDCGVSPATLKNYIQVLEDTLIGFSLPGYTKTKKRKAISRIKHYLFDVGICNQLCRRGEILPKSELYGNAFEHFLILEVRAWNSYSRTYYPLCYWRSTTKFEVDLIVGDVAAIEIKSTDLVQDKHLKGIRALKEENLVQNYIVVSQDREPRKTSDGIQIYPWSIFLEKLWAGELFV